MATGLSTKLTGQIGEHLVTAELGRKGIIATPFSGNVPEIDILAYANGKTGHIQVKAINKDSWQFDVRTFLEVVLVGKTQRVKGINPKLKRDVLCIFIAVGEELGSDEFYIFKQGWLQDFFKERYKGRKPPSNVNSFHCAIWKRDLQKHLGKWHCVTKKFHV